MKPLPPLPVWPPVCHHRDWPLPPRYVGSREDYQVHALLEQPKAREIGSKEQEVFVVEKVYPSKVRDPMLPR